VLDKLGHLAVFSEDGAGAVRALQAQAFDVVLMDLHMPGMDGFAAARAIRALPAPRGQVPIVALTADAFHEARDLARESGMNGFLTKPAHLPQLREALARYGGDGAGAQPPSVFAPAPPADPDKDGVFDQSIVDDLITSLSAELYTKMLNAFFEAQPEALAGLRRAASAGSNESLGGQAHGLKGAALSLGLRNVAEVAARPPPADAGATDLDRWIEELERQLALTHAACVQLGYIEP
jgi:CheY-like chemotaxis protein/HPt (histidine-containing phosphotransfer) domain-containing protein